MIVDYRKGEDQTESDDDTFNMLPFSKHGNHSEIFSATASNDVTFILVEDQGYLLLNKNIYKLVYMFSP